MKGVGANPKVTPRGRLVVSQFHFEFAPIGFPMTLVSDALLMSSGGAQLVEKNELRRHWT